MILNIVNESHAVEAFNIFDDKGIEDAFDNIFRWIDINDIPAIASLKSHWLTHGLTDKQKYLFILKYRQAYLTYEMTVARKKNSLCECSPNPRKNQSLKTKSAQPEATLSDRG